MERTNPRCDFLMLFSGPSLTGRRDTPNLITGWGGLLIQAHTLLTWMPLNDITDSIPPASAAKASFIALNVQIYVRRQWSTFIRFRSLSLSLNLISILAPLSLPLACPPPLFWLYFCWRIALSRLCRVTEWNRPIGGIGRPWKLEVRLEAALNKTMTRRMQCRRSRQNNRAHVPFINVLVVIYYTVFALPCTFTCWVCINGKCFCIAWVFNPWIVGVMSCWFN